jgi:hypothetical protein
MDILESSNTLKSQIRHLNLVCEHHDVIDVPITPENPQRQNRMHEHAKEQGDI